MEFLEEESVYGVFCFGEVGDYGLWFIGEGVYVGGGIQGFDDLDDEGFGGGFGEGVSVEDEDFGEGGDWDVLGEEIDDQDLWCDEERVFGGVEGVVMVCWEVGGDFCWGRR